MVLDGVGRSAVGIVALFVVLSLCQRSLGRAVEQAKEARVAKVAQVTKEMGEKMIASQSSVDSNTVSRSS